ncbi:hypothetical protein RB195_026158 [Necator americanus]|uniref:Uncharacterized protein n=1 Tax=Necator americanus TaxID=51031 RepID=A0ABR1EXU9_NECAM
MHTLVVLALLGATFPVYFPPTINEPIVANVRGGRDYGRFLDIFDGPHMRYPIGGFPGFPGFPGIYPPFYWGRHHGGHHRRDSGSRHRRACDSLDSQDC